MVFTQNLTLDQCKQFSRVWAGKLLDQQESGEALNGCPISQWDKNYIQTEINWIGKKMMGKHSTGKGSALEILQELFPNKFPK